MRLPILPIAQRFRSLFASCNRQSKIYNLRFFRGVLAQLVERLNGIEEVTGSNPVGSRISTENLAALGDENIVRPVGREAEGSKRSSKAGAKASALDNPLGSSLRSRRSLSEGGL